MLASLFFVVCVGSLAVSHGLCPIDTYASSSCLAVGGAQLKIHGSFRSSMNIICGVASRCNVKLHITSSFRKPGSVVLGAIVPPATLSNHNVGHAIDMNVVYGKNRNLCNSNCLRVKLQPPEVKCFINGVKAQGLRWGGDFSTIDTVHIDDGYNMNTTNYRALYKNIQKEC